MYGYMFPITLEFVVVGIGLLKLWTTVDCSAHRFHQEILPPTFHLFKMSPMELPQENPWRNSSSEFSSELV